MKSAVANTTPFCVTQRSDLRLLFVTLDALLYLLFPVSAQPDDSVFTKADDEKRDDLPC